MTQMEVCPTYREDGEATAGFKCNQCYSWVAYLHWQEWILDSRNANLHCECGNVVAEILGGTVSKDNATLAVRENHYDNYLGLSDVKTQKWYHATSRKKWLTNINEDANRAEFFPHVGTLETVEEFIIQTGEGDCNQDLTSWLYEVEILEVASIKDGTAVDDQVDAYAWARLMRKANADVVRYVNRFESPGSVSIVAVPHSLRVVKRISLEGYDPRQSSLEDFLAS